MAPPSEQRQFYRRRRFRTEKQFEELHVDEDPLAAGPDILKHPAGDKSIEPVRGGGSGHTASLDDVRDSAVGLLEKDGKQVCVRTAGG